MTSIMHLPNTSQKYYQYEKTCSLKYAKPFLNFAKKNFFVKGGNKSSKENLVFNAESEVLTAVV